MPISTPTSFCTCIYIFLFARKHPHPSKSLDRVAHGLSDYISVNEPLPTCGWSGTPLNWTNLGRSFGWPTCSTDAPESIPCPMSVHVETGHQKVGDLTNRDHACRVGPHPPLFFSHGSSACTSRQLALLCGTHVGVTSTVGYLD